MGKDRRISRNYASDRVRTWHPLPNVAASAIDNADGTAAGWVVVNVPNGRPMFYLSDPFKAGAVGTSVTDAPTIDDASDLHRFVCGRWGR